MVKYNKKVVEDDFVEAFQVKIDGPTPVPEWFPNNYEIIKVGVVFERSEGEYEVAKWGDYIIKSSYGLKAYPEYLFEYVYELAE